MFNKLKDKAKEKTEKVTKKIGESAKELKDKAKESVKGIQENFSELSENKEEKQVKEQFSNENKQKELADLHKLAMEAENVFNNWENKSGEAEGIIKKLKEYRDSKSEI